MKEKKKKTITRQVITGYEFTICEVDKKGNLKQIDTVIHDLPVLSKKKVREIEQTKGKKKDSLVAFFNRNITECYEMDLEFFIANARKVETSEEKEGE